MKNLLPLTIALSALLLLVACGDGQGERTAEAERHQRTAVTYKQQGQLRPAMLEARNAVQLQPRNAAGYIILAQIYNQVGAYASTQALLENVVKELPETSIELAEAYVATRKYRSALNLLNELPADTGDRMRQLSLQARAHIALGDQEAFESTLQSLEKLDNSSQEANYLRASFALSRGKNEEARRILEDTLASSPDHLKSLILLGELSLYNNQLERAENLLTQALSLVPSGDVMTVDRASVLAHLTQALIQQGRTSEAYTYQKLLADANPEAQVVQQKFADAMELYQQGKYAEAETLLKEIHAQFPNDRNTGTLLGLVQYQQGEDKEALDLFEQFLDVETANPSVIQAAAIAKYRTNQMDDAVALLKSAVENQPNDATILATYGLALLDRDETSNEGALALEKSLALNPAQQRLRIALAKRHNAMGKYEQAIAQLQKAYREQPLDLVIQQSYFKALFSQGLVEEVKAEIDAFREAYPNNPRGLFMEGWYNLQVKNFKAAQNAFEKSLGMPNNAEKNMVYSGLAQAYAQDKQLQKAAEVWQSALQDDPSFVAGYAAWLKIMRELNKGRDAIGFLSELEKTRPAAWQPSVVLAQLAHNQRQTEQAIKHIDIALERSNNAELVKRIAADLYTQRGIELRVQKKNQEARVSQLKAMEFYPNNILFLANLIDTELSDNNIAEAQKLLDQFAQTDENLAGHLFLQGAIYRADNKAEQALKLFRQSWDAQPSDNAAEALYSHYQTTNEQDQANRILDQWIEKLPQSPRPTLIKAIDLQQKNAVKEAIKWYEKTLELSPRNATALNNLAWLYYEQKDPRALELAKKAYDNAPMSPPILDTYGWILVEQGQVAEGLKYLERAANLAPSSKDIQEHLRQAKGRVR